MHSGCLPICGVSNVTNSFECVAKRQVTLAKANEACVYLKILISV